MREWIDRQYIQSFGRISGVDEAGRGPLAGPVVAAAVFLSEDQEKAIIKDIPYIDDSKKLSEKKRNLILQYVKENNITYGIGISSEGIIDNHNILMGTNMAMNKALEALNIQHDLALVDGKNLTINFPNRQLVKGDSISLRIALASNIAKTVRDKILKGYSRKYPQYDFKKNKGYGTADHLKALNLYGPTPFHRLTFRPLFEIITEKKLSEWVLSGQIDMTRYRRILLKYNENHIEQKRMTGFIFK